MILGCIFKSPHILSFIESQNEITEVYDFLNFIISLSTVQDTKLLTEIFCQEKINLSKWNIFSEKVSNGMLGGFEKVTDVVIVGSNKLLRSLLKVGNHKSSGSRE